MAAAATENTRRLFGLPVLPFDGTLRTKPSQQAHSPNVVLGICKVGFFTQLLLAYPKTNLSCHCIPNQMRVKKKADPKKADDKKESGEKEGEKKDGEAKPEKPIFFFYKGKKYTCSAKEKVILCSQQKNLDAEGFAKLFKDFDLKEVQTEGRKKK